MGFSTRQCKLFLVPRPGDMIRIRNIRMKTASTLLLILAALAAAAVAAFLLAGPARVWRVFGDPDLGPVVFETLQRRATPNDALACPPATCAAAVDIISPRFAATAADLRLAFARVLATEERIENTGINEVTLEDRYIQRSRLMGFPDTLNVKFMDLGGGQSSIALYSRSQLGRDDLGVNKARLERLLAKLTQDVKTVP